MDTSPTLTAGPASWSRTAGLVDTIELGVSPVLLGRPGTAMLAGHPSLPSSVRLELTRHEVFPTGLLVLKYAVRHGSA